MPARPPADPRLGVLFLQSQAFFGADSAIHAQLMRHLDRAAVHVHCACTNEQAHDPRMTALRRISEIPDVHVRITDFGPSVFGRPQSDRVVTGALTGAAMLRASARALALVGYARRHRIGIVHATEKPRDAFVGVVLARLAGARSLIQMHVGFDDWLSPRARRALAHADGIVGVSRFVSDSLVRAGCDAARVFTVHNSLDLQHGAWDRPRDRVAVRGELGIALDAPVICIASRLFRWKGHHDLVEAVSRLRPELANLRLIVVGEDDPRANPGFGSYRAELESRVTELGLERNVIFTGFRTDVADLMAASDVFCMPSAEEPFGMVYLEAMAMLRPVVAYASGGAPEVVAHGETGLLVTPGNIDALTTALGRLLRDGDLRRSFGTAGRRRVEEVFTPGRSAAAMLDVYRSISHSERGISEKPAPSVTRRN